MAGVERKNTSERITGVLKRVDQVSIVGGLATFLAFGIPAGVYLAAASATTLVFTDQYERAQRRARSKSR